MGFRMNSNKKGVQQNETISFKSMCEKYIFYDYIVVIYIYTVNGGNFVQFILTKYIFYVYTTVIYIYTVIRGIFVPFISQFFS